MEGALAILKLGVLVRVGGWGTNLRNGVGDLILFFRLFLCNWKQNLRQSLAQQHRLYSQTISSHLSFLGLLVTEHNSSFEYFKIQTKYSSPRELKIH